MRLTTLRLKVLAVGALSVAATMGVPSMARADTTSTAIIAGAAAIAVALFYDSSNHPYYVREGHRYYVTDQQASYYRQHHQGWERRAYVPEREYPIARSYNTRSYDNRDNRDEGSNRR